MSANANAWKELKEGLHLPIPENATPTSKTSSVPAGLAGLEKEVLKLWQKHDTSESELAPLLYELCQKLNAQGKKGVGFRAWLKAHKRPSSSAYRWIKSYATKEGLELPFPVKEKNSTKRQIPTSSQMGQGSSLAVVPDTAPFIAPPVSAKEAISVLGVFLEQVPATQRFECATELRNWLEIYIEGLATVSPQESTHADS